MRPIVRAFSSAVWKRPWPNLEAVSMNLTLTCSTAERDTWGSRDWRKVTSLLRVPATEALHHQVVVVHLTVVGEPANGVDALVRHVEVRGGLVGIRACGVVWGGPGLGEVRWDGQALEPHWEACAGTSKDGMHEHQLFLKLGTVQLMGSPLPAD